MAGHHFCAPPGPLLVHGVHGAHRPHTHTDNGGRGGGDTQDPVVQCDTACKRGAVYGDTCQQQVQGTGWVGGGGCVGGGTQYIQHLTLQQVKVLIDAIMQRMGDAVAAAALQGLQMANLAQPSLMACAALVPLACWGVAGWALGRQHTALDGAKVVKA